MIKNWKWMLPIIVTMLDIAVFTILLLLFRNQADILNMENDSLFFALSIWLTAHLPIALITGWLLPFIEMPHHEYGLTVSFIVAFICSSQTFLMFLFVGKWIDNKNS